MYANGELNESSELSWQPTQGEMYDSSAFASLQVAGDFYNEPNDVLRGLTLTGSFYHEPQDVVRGVTFDSHFDTAGVGTDFVKFGEDHLEKPFLKQSTAAQFEGTAAPRPLPSDEVEATSVTVEGGATAADVCNILYQYATNVVTSSNIKTNPDKYTIKASILHPDVGTCTMKMCVYSKEPHSGLVVVFRRRQGDAIASKRIFQHASAYLHSQLEKKREPWPDMERSLAAPGATSTTAETDLQPLMDMLAKQGAGELQTEAAMTLSAMAVVNASVAAYLCSALSSLPKFHRLEEYVLACASARCADAFPPGTDF